MGEGTHAATAYVPFGALHGFTYYPVETKLYNLNLVVVRLLAGPSLLSWLVFSASITGNAYSGGWMVHPLLRYKSTC